MNEEAFIAYLKTNYPYLYDIEMKVRKVQQDTGFGEISAHLTIRYKRIEIASLGEFNNYAYYKSNKV